jgi:hypothetical protein
MRVAAVGSFVVYHAVKTKLSAAKLEEFGELVVNF